jgi:hypothetical protein
MLVSYGEELLAVAQPPSWRTTPCHRFYPYLEAFSSIFPTVFIFCLFVYSVEIFSRIFILPLSLNGGNKSSDNDQLFFMDVKYVQFSFDCTVSGMLNSSTANLSCFIVLFVLPNIQICTVITSPSFNSFTSFLAMRHSFSFDTHRLY